MTSTTHPPKRVLAVASTGGHWEQMMRLAQAFDGMDIRYACTDARQADRFDLTIETELQDYNQNQPLKVLRGFGETLLLVRRVRPDVVISTGAAPGLLTLFWGRIFGAKVIWVDSIANSEKLSLSGKLALKFAHITLTQWDHLATERGAQYWGSIL